MYLRLSNIHLDRPWIAPSPQPPILQRLSYGISWVHRSTAFTQNFPITSARDKQASSFPLVRRSGSSSACFACWRGKDATALACVRTRIVASFHNSCRRSVPCKRAGNTRCCRSWRRLWGRCSESRRYSPYQVGYLLRLSRGRGSWSRGFVGVCLDSASKPKALN